MDFVRNLVTHRDLGLLKCKACLKVEPEPRGGIKEARKPERRVGGDAMTLAHHFINAWCRHAQCNGQCADAHGQRFEVLLPEDFPWVDWPYLVTNRFHDFVMP